MYKSLVIGLVVGALIMGVARFVMAPTEMGLSPAELLRNSEISQAVNGSNNDSVLVVGEGDTLDLSGRGLTEVPGDVFGRTEIEKLNLSQNELTGSLPAEVRHLTQLRVLDLSYNQFTDVPAEVGQLRNLQVLDLSYNDLTGLPHELGGLVQLEVLDLRGNEYSATDLNIIKKTLPGSVRILVD